MRRFLIAISNSPKPFFTKTLYPNISFHASPPLSIHPSALTLLQSPRLLFSTPPPAMSDGSRAFSSSLQTTFEGLHQELEESRSIRERIRSVATEMESATRLMQSNIVLLNESLPVSEVLEKARVEIDVLKELHRRLGEILSECPGQYYRYHGEWRSETQTAVSLLAFLHWLETGNLLLHKEAEEKLGLDSSEFGLDIEDYLIGLCLMSNELPRYVVNQVTLGDYDCPSKALTFLRDVHSGFLMLNLRNDLLRKKFDGMKYDLRRLQEIHYDVRIRGLSAKEAKQLGGPWGLLLIRMMFDIP